VEQIHLGRHIGNVAEEVKDGLECRSSRIIEDVIVAFKPKPPLLIGTDERVDHERAMAAYWLVGPGRPCESGTEPS
jgi:hypothetical protein